jgi:hypothetical protein
MAHNKLGNVHTEKTISKTYRCTGHNMFNSFGQLLFKTSPINQEISGFLDFIHCPVFEGTRFGNWICFRPQVKGGKKTPTLLGPLERANLNHWVGVFFPPSTWGRKQIQFLKHRVPSNTGLWIKSRNPEIPCVIHHCYNPIETTISNKYLAMLQAEKHVGIHVLSVIFARF